jgi:hypothetical protein
LGWCCWRMVAGEGARLTGRGGVAWVCSHVTEVEKGSVQRAADRAAAAVVLWGAA